MLRSPKLAVALLLALLGGCGPAAPAPVSPAAPIAPATRPADRDHVVVTGDLPTTGSLGIGDLATLPAEEFAWEHDGVTKTMRGVPMEAVLRKFGWAVGPGGREAGPADRRTGWRRAILVRSADGYGTAFSTAELTAENGPSKVYFVWEEDGKPARFLLWPDPAPRPDGQEGRAGRPERGRGARRRSGPVGSATASRRESAETGRLVAGADGAQRRRAPTSPVDR